MTGFHTPEDCHACGEAGYHYHVLCDDCATALDIYRDRLAQVHERVSALLASVSLQAATEGVLLLQEIEELSDARGVRG